ncbi:MAG: DMT family transporter [Gemmatimonadaceae bacterium]|nr:DMT family transporter [Acetobacteraceae bacterium]
MNILLYAAGILGGAFTNVAVGMNATLGKGFADHRMLAALTIQGVGLAALFLVALFGGAFASRPTAEALLGVPWWAWAGGGLTALTSFAVLVAAGATGAALFSALTVTGGTITAVTLDHFGLLGYQQRDATLLRLGGCALLIGGTVLVARG